MIHLIMEETNMETTQTNMETTLWHELDDQTAETISGGAEGCLAWSIRFGDVTRTPRNSSSQTPPIIWIW